MNILVSLVIAIQSQAAMPVYVDQVNGISIPIPSGWSVTHTNDPVTILKMSDSVGRISNLMLRKQAPLAAIRDGSMTWQTFVGMVVKGSRKQIRDYATSKIEATKIGGNPACYAYAGGTINGKVKIKNVQLFIATEKHFYVLTGTSSNEVFDKQKALFDSVCKGFKVQL